MTTKFSQFNVGGAPQAGDRVAGLRNGLNTLIDFPALPVLPWTTVLVGQPLAVNNGYIIDSAVPIVCTLPAAAAVGNIIQIINVGAGQVTIAQNALQQIAIGNVDSTAGVGGSINSTAVGDSIILLCTITNLEFFALGGPQGNWNLT